MISNSERPTVDGGYHSAIRRALSVSSDAAAAICVRYTLAVKKQRHKTLAQSFADVVIELNILNGVPLGSDILPNLSQKHLGQGLCETIEKTRRALGLPKADGISLEQPKIKTLPSNGELGNETARPAYPSPLNGLQKKPLEP